MTIQIIKPGFWSKLFSHCEEMECTPDLMLAERTDGNDKGPILAVAGRYLVEQSSSKCFKVWYAHSSIEADWDTTKSSLEDAITYITAKAEGIA